MSLRKKGNRMKAEKKLRARPQLPAIRFPWRVFSLLALAGLVGVAGWRLMDRPVRAISINAPFQRVTAMQIEEVVRAHLATGVLSTDLQLLRDELSKLPWIDNARARRAWPDEIVVTVTEQEVAARWGTSGLLNTRGELFIKDVRHVSAELPMLIGPPQKERVVAERYLKLHAALLPHGLQLRSVILDDRGAWRLQLAANLEVRLGREHVDQRIARFLELVTPLIAGRAEIVDYIDMRYANGFAIGWVTDERDTTGELKDA
ncbi:MAG: FtsQ-type POTRA domain-containing protein [Gammaproteobacteria bacterium]|nr:FtsQ-type POTRA domain-containing protein [Gammaproteobacteria bacterium]